MKLSPHDREKAETRGRGSPDHIPRIHSCLKILLEPGTKGSAALSEEEVPLCGLEQGWGVSIHTIHKG